jgi:hypothetical protein
MALATCTAAAIAASNPYASLSRPTAEPAAPVRVADVLERTEFREPRASFSARQREVIKRHATVRTTLPTSVPLAVGTEIPRSVEPFGLTDAAYAEAALLRPYRYLRVGQEIALIDPQENVIVEVVRD